MYHGLSKDVILLIDSLQKRKSLKMRVYAMISNLENDVNYFIENGPIKTNSLNVRSVKVYGDGALGSRGATLKEPYSRIFKRNKLKIIPLSIIISKGRTPLNSFSKNLISLTNS